jgi:hypothetical protein
VAETVFAGEQVKKLAFGNGFAFKGAIEAIFPWFTENFLVGYGPGNAGYRDGQNKQPGNLRT